MKPRVLCTALSSLICLALLMSPIQAGLPAHALPPPSSSNVAPIEQAEAPPIRLAVGEFDPLTAPGPAGLPATLLLSEYAGDGTGYYLVQFRGPITTSDVDALAAAGAEVFDYIPDFTFIVKMDSTTRAAVEQLEQVRWVGLYQPAYRLPADLRARASDGIPPSRLPKPSDGRQVATLQDLWDDSPVEFVVTIFRGEELAPIIARIQDMGGTVLDQSQTEWKSKLKVSILPSRLTDLAAIPGVRWIEEAPVWKLANNEAADIMDVRDVWNTHGLYGNGQTVAVCDTGLDRGSRSPASLHDDFENGSGVSRVVAIHDRVGDGASDVNSGHGTHVAGSVLGNGDLSGATPSTHSYPATAYAGMAPEASLVFQAVEDNSTGDLSGIPLDLNTLFAQAAGSGATLHSNSWGQAAMGMYDSASEDVDEYVWNHKNFTILFAAHNHGIDSNANGVVDLYSMASPGTAKNCITIGASENDRASGGYNPGGPCSTWGNCWPPDYPTNPVRDDALSDDPAGMAAFSNRGPALDGRIKPDLVAPGTNIASVRSAVGGTGWGAINANYSYMGGTSQSTPLAAGTATIVRQYYTDREGITPSAALIKATLANGATDINPGQYGTGTTREIPGTRPTNVAGWGRINLENSIFPTTPRTMIYQDETPGLNTGGSDTYNYTVTSAAEPFRVTLAWSDYPGSPVAAGGLVNDLDLMITGPGGTTYYPNNASQRGASQHLTYDDGMSTDSYSGSAGMRVAVRFTPTSYPAVLQTGLFWVRSKSGSYPKTFNWYVYSGSASGPTGSALASGSTTIRRAGWHAVDLSGTGVTISSGDFFLAIRLPDSDLAFLSDASTPVNGRSWVYSSGAWNNWTDDDFMFNAIVSRASASTSHDRVNNLVGIDIASPATGTYIVTVSGYNVPHGPQPYALVASGAIASATAPAPTVTSITPASGINTGTVHITNLAGTNFQSGATVKLTRSGQPDINASNVSVVSTSRITCDFDLRGASPGRWTVRVTNPDAQYAQLVNGFTANGLSSVPVSITESGFAPSVVTITVGTTVVWTNHTQETVHLVSGEPYHIYLPLVLRNTCDSGGTATSAPMTGAVVTRQQDNWGNVDIAPGESYAHTFATAGHYPYFLAGHPDMTGLVVVQASAPDFALGVQPLAQGVVPGEGVTYTVAVTALHGFASSITLDVGGLPTGTAVSWATNPLVPTADTTLAITPATSSPAGTYTLVITGTGDGQVHTTPFTLTVLLSGPEPGHYTGTSPSVSFDVTVDQQVCNFDVTIPFSGGTCRIRPNCTAIADNEFGWEWSHDPFVFTSSVTGRFDSQTHASGNYRIYKCGTQMIFTPSEGTWEASK